MDHQQSRITSARRSLKRKLERDFKEDEGDQVQAVRKVLIVEPQQVQQDLDREILAQVAILDNNFSSAEPERAAAKRAVHVLSEFAKSEELVNLIVESGAVPALVRHLQAPAPVTEGDAVPSYEHEVERGSAFALGLLAVKPEHQQVIVDAEALPYLLTSLMKIAALRPVSGLKVEFLLLLNCLSSLIQRYRGQLQGALRTLAFKNDENKNQIIECNALPTLILMLQSDDAAIHYEAVGVIGNLVHSSPNIKIQVLLAGALQPVIRLLSSCCLESQREAALLVGQFAATDADCKVHIVQRGAVQPLIDMLHSPDAQLREMSAFALGRLAQFPLPFFLFLFLVFLHNSYFRTLHNQAGIAHSGGLEPLLDLLGSKNGSLQHNAAFALYGLADNEDNVADIVKVGGVQKLQDGEFTVQPTKECVAKTLKRLEEKIHGQVLKHLLYLMRFSERVVQRRVALALAHFCAPDDRRAIFIDNNGLELLLGLLESTSLKQKKDVSVALYKLATKSTSLSPVDAAPPSPTPQVYLGEQYVNNPTLSDVSFLVEGKRFYAHRICLLASSDIFRAMFDGGYRERDATDIEIPNIKWDVFELMMRFIYTGSVDVNPDIAQDLLKAADQYLLEGLKRLCEYAIAQDISVENVPLMYELSEAFNAMSLRQACILFVLEQFDKLTVKPWYNCLVHSIRPDMPNFFTSLFTKS
ncbi:ARM repeat protein interacting with ABF2 [Quillaja saponaria]|uniref:ARM repeat protein interacting with ABF2 n=1 Tax=Quillaja saponaria TaxID=32244 RepID=A0AAD7Q9J9_QUISA|nr:ARM repeat protein interacting with ABF2 [Quillaja saponaria]